MIDTLAYFDKLWHNHNFPHAWHISSENTDYALDIVKKFSSKIFLQYTNINIENNPDFLVVSNEGSETKESSKFITVDQVRKVIEFLSKSSSITPYKIVVINKAESMNNNAFNSCLKILEEPSLGCFIFLITGPTIKLPATINSRCRKLHIKCDMINESQEIFNQLIKILDTPTIEQIDNIINLIVQKKNQETWQRFTDCCLNILSIICKIKTESYIDEISTISNYELLSKIASKNAINYLISNYEDIRKLLNNAFEQDLDRKQTILLVMDRFLKLIKS